MKKIVIVLVAALAVAMAGVAMAATATNNLTASATAISSCRIDSVSNVAFGNYDPTDSTDNTAGSGSIVSRCTKNTTYRIYITGTRTMTDGTDLLEFDLYSDAGRTSVFPSTFAGATPATAANNSPTTTNVYGKIPAQDNVQAGSYSATLSATVEY